MGAELLIPMLVDPLVMLVILGVACGATVGRIPRNHFIGIRLRSTLASDTAWRAGHRAAVRPAVISLALTLIADVAVVLLTARGFSVTVLPMLPVIPVLLCGVWIVIVSARAARKTSGPAG